VLADKINVMTILKNISIAINGIAIWVIYFKKPFNSEDYISEYRFDEALETSEGAKKKEAIKPLQDSKSYTRISGIWLNFPKLHYYTFNWNKDERVKKELATRKPLLQKALETQIQEQAAIVVFFHELSRSGAPILGMDLAKRFKKLGNVVVISLKKGPLEENLKEMGIPVFIVDWEDELLRSPLLELILKTAMVNRAVVNSICSYPVARILKKQNIPFLTLVHEFASYIADKEIYPLIHDSSYSVYYPSRLVSENAFEVHPDLKRSNVSIMPQGLIKSPISSDAWVVQSEYTIIKNAFQRGGDRDVPVILGVGSIEPRKGVDLFISTAQTILRNGCAKLFRFVWIGGPLNDFHKLDYKVHLNEQIKRAGLSEYVILVDPITNLGAAYDQADVFFLSSRLDPLPLVSIEAMENGLPLVCFEGASGIADYLKDDEKTASMVVPYLDVESAAHKICELINDPEARIRNGRIQQAFSRRRFDMDVYAMSILDEFGNCHHK
jgi:glycosyltransferase involved in cell wall biosynthesis